MRVIAGTCRSMPLATLPGTDTRPTSDRVKETLFNVLMPCIPGCRFLDLFAGSGAIGIEALSRGAEFCTFVDSNRKAARVIEDNLAFTKLAERAEVLPQHVFAALSDLSVQGRRYDVIFMDPPYDKGLEKEVLTVLPGLQLGEKDALYVVEASLSTDFTYLADAGFRIWKEKRYKNNCHLFLERI